MSIISCIMHHLLFLVVLALELVMLQLIKKIWCQCSVSLHVEVIIVAQRGMIRVTLRVFSKNFGLVSCFRTFRSYVLIILGWWGYRSKWTFVERTSWKNLCCRHMRFCQPSPTLISHVWLFLSLYSYRYSSFNFYIPAWNKVKHWFKESEVCTSHDVSLSGCSLLRWWLLQKCVDNLVLIKQSIVEWTKTVSYQFRRARVMSHDVFIDTLQSL